MVFVKVDLDSLKKFSRNLDLWRTDAVNARNDGYKQCSVEDPANIAEYFGSSATMQSKLTDLFHLKGSLDTRIVNVEAVNQTGISPMDNTEGGYYLPDGVADTAENVTAYNKHAIDMGKDLAKELRGYYEGVGPTNDKAYDVLKEIQKHQDIPTFGAAFLFSFDHPTDILHAVGALYDPDDQEESQLTLSVLSHTFAAATRHRDGSDGEALANQFADVLTKKLGYDQLMSGSVLLEYNALLSQPGVAYDTGFLLTSANRLENIDQEQVRQSPLPFMRGYDYWSSGQDPMFGVVSAMGGNSEAALKYLADEGTMQGEYWIPSDKTKDRWAKLEKRTDSNFVDSFSGALAAASGYRNTPSDPNDPLYKPSGEGGYREYLENGDARATWLTAKALNHFSEDYSADKFTEKMKANVGTMLSNSPEELAAASLTEDVDGNTRFDKGPNIAGSVDGKKLTKLFYRVADNESAATAINASLGAYYHNEIEEAKSKGHIKTHEDLAEMYRRASLSQTYLNTVTEIKLKDEYDEGTAEYEMRKNKADSANAVFSTIATTGVTAVTAPIGGATALVAPALTTAGLSVVGPFDAGFYEDPKSGVPGGKEGMATPDQVLRAGAYANAADQGLLSASHADAAKRSGVLYDDKGNVVHPDPNSFTDEEWGKVNTWRESARKNAYETDSDGNAISGVDGGPILKNGSDGTVVSLDSAINDGVTEGKISAEQKLSKNPSLKK